jgi:hypothetical protein
VSPNEISKNNYTQVRVASRYVQNCIQKCRPIQNVLNTVFKLAESHTSLLTIAYCTLHTLYIIQDRPHNPNLKSVPWPTRRRRRREYPESVHHLESRLRRSNITSNQTNLSQNKTFQCKTTSNRRSLHISLQKKKAKGLHAFGFSTKPLEAPIDGDVTMKVHVAVAGTVKLTVQKTFGKCPKSLLARDRIMPVNHPIEKPVLEKKQEEKATKAKRELIRLRAKENPIFVVGSGGNHLWCTGCGGIVSPKSAHIKDHVATKKHKQALVKNSEEIASSKKSRDFIAEYFKASHEAGEKIDLKTLNFRFDTLTEFLRNGTLYQHTVHPSLFVDLTEYLLL